MAKCSTCGDYHVIGDNYTCSACVNLKELRNIRQAIVSQGRNISGQLGGIDNKLASIDNTLERSFHELTIAFKKMF